MQCRVCQEQAGWWRRHCEQCRRLLALFATHRGADMGTFMDLFIASGVPRAKVERFLDTNLDGQGAVRDQIAADMANQLMEALGQRGRQTPAGVKRLRERGNWVHLDRPPEE